MQVRVFECTARDKNDKPIHFKISVPYDTKIKQAVKLANEYLKDIKHESLTKENFKLIDLPMPTTLQLKGVVNQEFYIEKITRNCP